MSHERHEENIGAYLLGALPELERQALERHIERCVDCRSTVERLRPATDALPRAATPLTPPPRLKASLMEAVERDARAPRARRRILAGFLSPRLRMRPAAAWAGAALLFAVGAAGGFTLADELSDGEPRRVSAQVDLPRASAELVVDADGSTAVLHTKAMPSLDEGSVYQVWVARDGEVIPQSLFQVGPDGRGAGVVTDGVDGAEAVMVTREPAGGSPAPTEQPVVTVEL